MPIKTTLSSLFVIAFASLAVTGCAVLPEENDDGAVEDEDESVAQTSDALMSGGPVPCLGGMILKTSATAGSVKCSKDGSPSRIYRATLVCKFVSYYSTENGPWVKASTLATSSVTCPWGWVAYGSVRSTFG